MIRPTIQDKQKTLFKRVKTLKNNATESELLFKAKLENAKIKFIFQKAFIAKDYYCIVDFYLPKPLKICVEIDGGYHNEPEQIKKDKSKDRYLKERGFSILRIKNEDVESFDINMFL